MPAAGQQQPRRGRRSRSRARRAAPPATSRRFEGEHVAAAQAHAPDRGDVDHQRHGRDAAGAQHEGGDGLHRVDDVEQRHPGHQRQRRRDDRRRRACTGVHHARRARRTRVPAQQRRQRDADLQPVPAEPPRVAQVAPAPMRCATSVPVALRQRQRHHEQQRHQVGGDLVARHRRRADARDEERHEREAGHLDQDRQPPSARRASAARAGRPDRAGAGRGPKIAKGA